MGQLLEADEKMDGKTDGKNAAGEPKEAEDEWLKQWRELAEEVGEAWPEGVSPVAVVSEMRG